MRCRNLIALHGLSDQLHDNAAAQLDTIAERITAPGGTPLSTIAAVLRGSSTAPYPKNISAGSAHPAVPADRLAGFGRKVRAAIATAASLDDADSSALLGAISRDLDKYLWLLKIRLEADH